MKAPSAARQGKRRCARNRDRCGAEKVGCSCKTMASTPWRGCQPARSRSAEILPRLRCPELAGVDIVVLHLEVQRFVVGSKEPRRLALVPPGGLEDPVDRLPLGVRRGRVGDPLEREAYWGGIGRGRAC